jgi:hypothetical protein
VTKNRILETAGFMHHSQLPKGPNGRALCRYCGNEVPPDRKTFCGGQKATFTYKTGLYIQEGSGCVHQHCVRSQPGYARKCVWARDQGQCALCSTKASKNAGWQADHTLPVIEGGGSCDLDNLRTLCTKCHAAETAKLAARRAEARKKEKQAMTILARLAQGPSQHPRPWTVLVDYQGNPATDEALRLEFIRRDGAELTRDDCTAIREGDTYTIALLPDSPPDTSLVSMLVKDEIPDWFKRVAFRDWPTKEEALDALQKAGVQLVERLPRETST